LGAAKVTITNSNRYNNINSSRNSATITVRTVNMRIVLKLPATVVLLLLQRISSMSAILATTVTTATMYTEMVATITGMAAAEVVVVKDSNSSRIRAKLPCSTQQVV
jgi:hypothetical protein